MTETITNQKGIYHFKNEEIEYQNIIHPTSQINPLNLKILKINLVTRFIKNKPKYPRNSPQAYILRFLYSQKHL